MPPSDCEQNSLTVLGAQDEDGGHKAVAIDTDSSQNEFFREVGSRRASCEAKDSS